MPIENRVDDGVDGGRHVAQPQTRVDDAVWHVASWTRGKQYVEHEERRPAQHESEEDQPQHLGRLLLGEDGVNGRRMSFPAGRKEPQVERRVAKRRLRPLVATSDVAREVQLRLRGARPQARRRAAGINGRE